MNSKQVEKLRMEKARKIAQGLGCTYDEAYQVVLDDEAVDKMTSVKEIESYLTDEQRKISKEMRSTTSGKPQTRKPRSKVIDVNKRELWTFLSLALTQEASSPTMLSRGKGINIVSVDDKELVVTYGAKQYKIAISTPRPKKEEV